MCLTLPAKVLSVSPFQAEIIASGKNQVVKLGTSDKIFAGDWVLFTGDYLIKKIDEVEAKEIFELLGSYKEINVDNLDLEFKEIISNSKKRELIKNEIEKLLSLESSDEIEAMCAEANIVRKESIKDHICIHGIIEFSNHCSGHCHYCGLRQDNLSVHRYRMEPREIIDVAVEAANEKGYKILVLQSGEDNWYDEKKLIEIVRGIKEKARVFIYLSIGDRSVEIYRKLKEAGANGVLYRFETTNAKLFTKFRPGKKLEDRINLLRELKKMNYVISTGSIIGLPGQSISDLANDILLMKELDTFMPSMGPLIPSSGTPLEYEKKVDFDLVLKMIAVSRLVMPKSRISVTTAMETVGGEETRKACFMVGANSVMFNLTPEQYRKDYYIYENKFFDKEKKYEKWALFKGELSYQMMEEELQISI
ncbi:MAG: radical SAM protein [Patescibacteria group bacterium]|jgi:biotin synthase